MEQTQSVAPQALIESYLDAVREKDISRCLDFYHDDARLHFMMGVFKGKKAIADWHKERFDAEMEIVRVGKITTKGDTVSVDASVTSKKIRAFKIARLAGKASFRLDDGKIKEVKLSPRIYNPFEGW